jgi:hypothetical protein
MMVQQISLERSTNEQHVVQVKANYANGSLCRFSSPTLRVFVLNNVTQRYNATANTFNAWIDGYTVDLTTAAGSQASYWKNQLADAVTKADDFHKWVTSSASCGANPPSGAFAAPPIQVAAPLIEPLTNAGIAIEQEYRQANADRRKEIESKLNAEKWKPFDQVT